MYVYKIDVDKLMHMCSLVDVSGFCCLDSKLKVHKTLLRSYGIVITIVCSLAKRIVYGKQAQIQKIM